MNWVKFLHPRNEPLFQHFNLKKIRLVRCLNSRKAKEQGRADKDGAKERAMIVTHRSKKEKELVVSLGPLSL